MKSSASHNCSGACGSVASHLERVRCAWQALASLPAVKKTHGWVLPHHLPGLRPHASHHPVPKCFTTRSSLNFSHLSLLLFSKATRYHGKGMGRIRPGNSQALGSSVPDLTHSTLQKTNPNQVNCLLSSVYLQVPCPVSIQIHQFSPWIHFTWFHLVPRPPLWSPLGAQRLPPAHWAQLLHPQCLAPKTVDSIWSKSDLDFSLDAKLSLSPDSSTGAFPNASPVPLHMENNIWIKVSQQIGCE